MSERRVRASVLPVLLLLAGCSVAAPISLEQDGVFVDLGRALREESGWAAETAPLVAVAPVRLSYLNVPTATSSESEDELPYSWRSPPLEEAALQRRLADVLEWSLYQGSRQTPLIDPARVEASAEDENLLRGVCRASDRLGAHLVVEMDVTAARVSWVRRDGLWWWGNLVAFWSWAFLPVVFIPDEVYEVSITAQVRVAHARTGEVLLSETVQGTASRSLNDPQRGWSVSGLLWLSPYFLDADEGDYLPAYESLVPHALKDLWRSVAEGLRRGLPEALKVPKHRKLLREGTEDSARTYALIVGHNGPRSLKPRPPLRHAEADAEALAAQLRSNGTVQSPEHLRLLVGDDVSPEAVHSAIKELAPRLLKRDRLLVYYAGYGRTTEDKTPTLVLAGDPLPVPRLATWCAEETVERGNGPPIVFLLDTSFGPEARGRSYRSEQDPGGPAPEPVSYLADLGRKALGWTVIVASGPRESAFEIDASSAEMRHGFFTQRLLAALAGEADTAPADGVIRTDELYRYLLDRVPEDVRPFEEAEQTPRKRGTEESVVVGVIAARPRRDK